MRGPSKHLEHLALAIRATFDVAMIIIIFFIVAGKRREYINDLEPPNIELPYATMRITDPDDQMATIYVGLDKVMLELPDTVKRLALIGMGEKHKINFSGDELEKFKKVQVVAVPTHDLKGFIDDYGKKPYYNWLGIKIDSTGNELADWISESNKAFKKVSGIGTIHFYIYADRRLKYPQIKTIFNMLTDQGIHKFSLIYWVKSKDDYYVN